MVHVEPARLGAVRGPRVRRGAGAGLAPGAPEQEAVEGGDEVVVAPERREGGADGRGGPDEPGAGALPRAKVGEDAPLDAAGPAPVDPGARICAVDDDGVGVSGIARGDGALNGARGLQTAESYVRRFGAPVVELPLTST